MSKQRVLLADDDQHVLRAYRRVLEIHGFEVVVANDGRTAVELIDTGGPFSVVISDIAMPDVGGLELLRAIRERDLDVPVILMTGAPSIESASRAIEYGALRYLVKPIATEALCETVANAAKLHEVAKLKRQLLDSAGESARGLGDRASVETRFSRAIGSMWMAYQPIVRLSQRRILGHEALLRSEEPSLPHPAAVLEAAERLGRLHDLGRSVRDKVASNLVGKDDDQLIFVNLHSGELLDDSLYDRTAEIGKHASRVVLEITERAALEQVPDVRTRIDRLREQGFRIALDDLGAGYAGLTSFAMLSPDVIKLDRALVMDIHKEPLKTKLVRSIVSLCNDMNLLLIAEGVESRDELAVLQEVGCDVFQGYLFARPGKPFPEVQF